MHKIKLIIFREYLTRVRKKSFIIMTLLGPLIFGSIIVVPAWLATSENSGQKVVAVIDESGLFADSFKNQGDDNIIYEYVNEPLEEAKSGISSGYRYGLLQIPKVDLDNPQGITFFSEGSPSLSTLNDIRQKLRGVIKDIKLKQSSISKEALARLESDVRINTINLAGDGTEQQGSSSVSSVVGYVSAFMIYGFIFLYGAQVMRGVIEEKTSRIIEVIISSVKPFQLMMGKIIGVASVGLTQFILWVILTLTVATIAFSIFQPEGGMDAGQVGAMAQSFPEAQAAQSEVVTELQNAMNTINIPLILFCFLFFFLGGYLLYGALFAAIGSAADSDTDTQQFMLPIAAPLIFSIVTLASVLNEPNGTMAFWLSMIPFTSPVTMMMRVPFGVPTWQLILSMLLLIGGFILTTWVASRVYRIGILTHGTKVNYKTLGRWLFTNN